MTKNIHVSNDKWIMFIKLINIMSHKNDEEEKFYHHFNEIADSI